MQHRSDQLRFVICLMAALSTAGCSKPSAAQLFPVDGVVTVDGKPAVDAIVQLTPKTGSVRNIAAAITDHDGKFRLSTPAFGPGVVPGTYEITVVSRPNAATLPAQYASTTTSRLTVIVGEKTPSLILPLISR